MTETLAHGVPKRIWMAWFQGLDAAPPIVKPCYESWRRHHPDWHIQFLDEQNLAEFVEVDALRLHPHNASVITKNAYANLVRMYLLHRYGGVWVDATCFCVAPLETWLPDYTPAGFFAFHRPSRSNLISNWFLASEPGCYLMEQWLAISLNYWRTNVFYGKDKVLANPIKKLIIQRLEWHLNSRLSRTHYWLHPLVRHGLHYYPYFWHHYHFERLVSTDAKAGDIWERTPRYSARVPLRLFDHGLLKPLSAPIRQFIDARETPLHKLTWKYNPSDFQKGCTLDYLLQSCQ
ncbi:MAG: hypothetical protein IGQ88_09000 [Gloeomargaritaceae cyanobacterium C42_A2020_066]|nr:hypothetical protein [Gloeomargaritaceae cyanobacterium C42_A2020_066]